jgi:hypothetical protein
MAFDGDYRTTPEPMADHIFADWALAKLKPSKELRTREASFGEQDLQNDRE